MFYMHKNVTIYLAVTFNEKWGERKNRGLNFLLRINL